MSNRTRRAGSRNASEENLLQRLRRNVVVRFLVVLLLFWIAVGAFLALIVMFHYHRLAGDYDIGAVARIPMESTVLDGTGQTLGYLHGENATYPVALEQVSPHFVNALIAREDSRFWKHGGIDYVGTVRAWARNFKDKRVVQGASTITMQLTRMTYGMRDRTIKRKLLEMAIARRVEGRYKKEEILTHYLNRIFLGTGMNGIQQASIGYFGKNASELTLAESAMIAGIIRAPNGFSPFRHYETALREMRMTLDRMVDEGTITAEEGAAASNQRPQVRPQEEWMELLRRNAKVSEDNWILDMVERKVKELVPSLAESGGLKVETTFDLRIQNSAEQSVENWLSRLENSPNYSHPLVSQHQEGDPRYLQASSVVLENHTGAIRALVGGRNYSHSAFNRATGSKRQVGSVFKPLVYATAFEKGLFPGMFLPDTPLEPGEIDWYDSDWSPENSDGEYYGPTPVALGLIRSRNTLTVRVGEQAGIDNVLNMMDLAGLSTGKTIEPTPTVYIGNIGSNVFELTSAYSVFPTGGVRHQPFFIERILDRDDTVLYEHSGANYRVVSSGAAWMTTNVLKRVLEEGGTGASLRNLGFSSPAGGKTGTTNDFHDAWFVGFTSRLTAGVWVGLDQPATINPGAYGGRVAIPVWKDIMSDAQSIGYEFNEFAAPEEVIEMNLCRSTGMLADDSCKEVYTELVPHDLIPRKFCSGSH